MHKTPKEATRLLVVTDNLHYGGGSTKLSVQLAIALKKLYPYDIHFAYLEGQKIEKKNIMPLQLIPQLDQAHIPHKCLQSPVDIKKNCRLHHYYNTIQTTIQLTGVVKRFRPHILHSHTPGAALHSSLVPISPLMHIEGIHGKNVSPTFQGMREYLWRKWMQWRIHHHIPVSQRFSRYWQKKYQIPSKSVTCIPNCIADIFFDSPKARTLPSKNTPIRIGVAGRFDLRQKRQDVAIQACDILHQKGIQATLSLAGGGKDEEKIREIAGAYPKAKVHFAGSLNDEKLCAWYDALDILMLSSDYEPFGMVVAEGAARGLPFVATDTDGPPEIDEGAGNVIVPRGDAQALAKGVETLLTDKNDIAPFQRKISPSLNDIKQTLSPKNTTNAINRSFSMHNTPKEPTRLLMIVYSLRFGGGAEKLAVQLALSLKKLYPYDIHIAYLHGGDSDMKQWEKSSLPMPLISKLEQAHIAHSWIKSRAHIKKNRKFQHYCNIIQSSIRLKKVVKRFQPHIIHSHCLDPDIYVSLMPVSKIAHVRTIHGAKQYPNFGRIRGYILDKWVQWRTRQNIIVSQGIIRLWQKKYQLPAKRMTYIPNCIADIFFDSPKARTLPSKTSPIRIGVAGRLELIPKRQDLAIQACDILHQKGIHVTLSLAGGGKDEEKIREIAEAYPQTKVHFAGSLNDERLCAWYDSLDILMLSSDYEAFGMVLAEGAARGLPLVATDTDGPRDIDGGAGNVIVPTGDAQALAKGVETFLADKKRYSTASEKNIALSRRYKGDLCAKKHHQIYQSVLLHA